MSWYEQMKIWLDVSLLNQSLSTPHGIARVESNLSYHFQAEMDQVGFFWIDSNKKIHFSDEPPKETLINNVYLNVLRTEAKGERIKLISQAFISLLPPRAGDLGWKFGKRIYDRLVKSYKMQSVFDKSHRPYLNYSQNIKKRNSLVNKTVNPNDIFFIASNDWDRRIFEVLEKEFDFNPRLAFVIYDLIPYTHPNFAVDLETASRFTYWIAEVAQKAEFLFHISHYTKNTFDSMLKVRGISSFAKSLVVSLPPGLTRNGKAEEPIFSGLLNKKFVLVVCTLEVRKNHKVLVGALKQALLMSEDFPQLVFVGSRGWGYDEIRRDLELNEEFENRLLHFSGVPDAQLRWLYAHATAFAYPSFVEGLGLPILEAREFNLPILCSTAEVFREVIDESAIVLSPHDPVSWKNEIQKIVRSDWKPNYDPIYPELTWKSVVLKIKETLDQEKFVTE